MNDNEYRRYRQLLDDLREECSEMLQTVKQSAGTVELDQTRVGRVSRMDAMQTQQMALETGRRHQLQLIKIEGALKRLDSGEFGCCFVCGEQIASERLLFDPTSTRCTACME